MGILLKTIGIGLAANGLKKIKNYMDFFILLNYVYNYHKKFPKILENFFAVMSKGNVQHIFRLH